MSHLRDIQKLRQHKNHEHIVIPPRYSLPNPVDIYNVSFERHHELEARSPYTADTPIKYNYDK